MSTTVIRVTRPIIIFWYLSLLTRFNDQTNLTGLQVPCGKDPEYPLSYQNHIIYFRSYDLAKFQQQTKLYFDVVRSSPQVERSDIEHFWLWSVNYITTRIFNVNLQFQWLNFGTLTCLLEFSANRDLSWSSDHQNTSTKWWSDSLALNVSHQYWHQDTFLDTSLPWGRSMHTPAKVG